MKRSNSVFVDTTTNKTGTQAGPLDCKHPYELMAGTAFNCCQSFFSMIQASSTGLE
jgi:hypothetical protein